MPHAHFVFLHINMVEATKKVRETKMGVGQYSSKFKRFIISLSMLSLIPLLVTINSRPKPHRNNNIHRPASKTTPIWYDVLSREMKGKKMKIGLVNTNESISGIDHTMVLHFDRVAEDKKWEDFFPEWIDEDEKWGKLSCPKIPMPPHLENYAGLNVIVARVPCNSNITERENVRDVFRLQVNLVVANVLARSIGYHEVDPTSYAVFIGSCGPMWEIFRCDDLLWHEGDYWVYRPDLRRLKQKAVMPVGSCNLAPPPFAQTGQEVWRRFAISTSKPSFHKPRAAYVTVLHSSETYVCGAIALAQSIIQTNTTKDLILLADHSISKNSLLGLQTAGWKIKHIDRIRSPHAERGAYNEWNYSKLRIWQLTDYDKLIFIDADLIVLKNMDKFFFYPQLSATANDKFIFNSGVMLVEPSACTFETLMAKRFELSSYNGGDQGFLNEAFIWWHRWHSRLNHLKFFVGGETNRKHEIPDDIYTIHYLGLKPWMCYEDYDCNWDMLDHHPFASDAAHRKWWEVYNAMAEELRPYCGLSEGMEERIRKWRGRAKSAGFPDGHWKIKVKDQRQHNKA